MLASRLLGQVSARDGRAAFAFALAAYGLFSLFDWITTAFALSSGGTEGNPLAAAVFSSFGNAGLLVFKAVVVAAITATLVFFPRRIMSLRVATWVAAIFAIVSAIIVLHNVHAYGALLDQHRGPTYHASAPSARLI